jgi:Skp family chaperone for outer membrane proteins
VLEVRKSYLLFAVLGCAMIAGLVVYSATAQGPGRPAASPQMAAPTIAVVDVGYIFKWHTGFKAMKDSLEAEMKQAADLFKQRAETIDKQVTQLKGMPPGTEAYKQLEESVAKSRADLQIQYQLQQKEFAVKEANIYHTVFQAIEKEVGYVARQNGVIAVFRFNGDPVDPGEPANIIRNVNKQLIWFDTALDMTPEIVRRLNLKNGTQTANPSLPGQRSGVGVRPPLR